MAGVAQLFNGHILDKSNAEVDLNDSKYKGKVIGLYFSAHWYVCLLVFDHIETVCSGVRHAVGSLQF
jgi:hypothetical protein